MISIILSVLLFIAVIALIGYTYQSSHAEILADNTGWMTEYGEAQSFGAMHLMICGPEIHCLQYEEVSPKLGFCTYVMEGTAISKHSSVAISRRNVLSVRSSRRVSGDTRITITMKNCKTNVGLR